MSIVIKNRWTDTVIATVDDTDDLREAVIRLTRQGVSLRAANLRDADLQDANLQAANLRAANLRDANLRDANLRDANLQAANLQAADLQAANLRAANLRDADLQAANLRAANLRAANLRDANLRDANLQAANLRDADLQDANLQAANLRDANLDPIRDDFYAVLSQAPAEVLSLIEALASGRVNGSTYSDGECGCLVGTLAIASGVDPTNLEACSAVHKLIGKSSRPIERFFLGIKRGDTPANSQFSKLAHDWALEWLERMRGAFGPREALVV